MYKRDKVGKFARYDYKIIKRNRKAKLITSSILLSAGILALAVVGGQSVYNQASQRVKDLFDTKIETAVAESPEPTDMKEWVLWKVKQAGIDEYEAYAIVNCESRWNPEAVNGSHNNGGNGTDLGLWQINTKFQPQVKPSCSVDYKCSTIEAIKIYEKRDNWSAWSCSKLLNIE